MNFHYDHFISELRLNPNASDWLRYYEKHVDTLQGRVEKEIWYKELVNQFPSFTNFEKPLEPTSDIDWDLFIKLIASSFTSEIHLKKQAVKNHLFISVKIQGKIIEGDISTFSPHQIQELMKVWIVENVHLCNLCYKNDYERKRIFEKKRKKFLCWKEEINVVNQSN